MNAFRNMGWAKITFLLAIAVIATTLFVAGHHAEGFLVANGGAVTIDELASEFKTKMGQFSTITQEVKEMQTELKAKTATNDATLQNIKEQVDGFLTKFNEQKADITDLAQKLAQRAQEEGDKGEKSWGEQFVNCEAFKAAEKKSSRRGLAIGHEVKTVTSTAAGGLIRSQRENGIVALPKRRFTIRDLLTTIPTNTSSVDYAKQLTRTNNAAPVAEGTAKPYSDYTWGSATVVVRTLAHLAKITRQALDDAPRLAGEIDSEMRYGLQFVEETQFLYGSGVGENLAGIIPQATAFAVPAGVPVMANGTRIDVLRIAMLQNILALYPADGIVLNDLDWAVIEMTKTTDGAYLFANPQGSVEPRLWGLPIVTTPAMTAGDFLVGNFAIGANIYDRMAVEVLVSTENADDFEKNLATVRAEERVAIAVKRPTAFTKGTFTTALTDVTT